MRRITTTLFLLLLAMPSVAQNQIRKELPIIADYTPNVGEEMFKSNKHSNSILADGDEKWNALSGDPRCNGVVFTISGYERTPYIGGAFDSIDGVRARGIAVLGSNQTDQTFSEIGGGITGTVYCIYEKDYKLYVGGRFTKAGDSVVSNIAIWDGQKWETLDGGTDSTVLALTSYADYLYVGGNFRRAGGSEANYIARWHTKKKTWEPIIVDGVNGMDGGVAVLDNDEYAVYAGGGFVKAGNTIVNKIAKYDTSKWIAIDRGVTGKNAYITAIRVSYLLDMIGGSFDSAGEYATANIAKYDYASDRWYPEGIGTDGPVYAINDAREPLVIGGDFQHYNGISANNIVGSNDFGQDFGPWGSGVNGPVFALLGEYRYVTLRAGPNPVFVGGAFSSAGGKPSPYFAVHEGPESGGIFNNKPNIKSLRAYPTPASTSVTIELPIDASSLLITDAIGRTVKVLQPNQGKDIKVDVSRLPNEMYNAIAKSKDGVSVATFVVAR